MTVPRIEMSLYNYIEVPNSNLTCCICRTPFADPVTTRTCTHTFCRECILRALQHAGHCPIDRSPLSVNDLAPASPIVRSLVDELVVECVHRAQGCEHTCQRQLLAGHLLESCVYREVPCPEGKCEEMVVFKDLKGHVHDVGDEKEEKKSTTEPVAAVDEQEPDDSSNEDSTAAPAEDGAAVDLAPRIAALTADNIILRHRVDTLENLVSGFRREMNAVKHALGPWYQAPNSPRYYSTEMAVGMQPSTASTSVEYQQPAPYVYAQSYPPSLLPPADELAAYFPNEQELHSAAYHRPQVSHRTSSSVDLASYDGHALVAPLNLGTTLEGTLHGVRDSVVGLATGVDAVGRRQELAAEEVVSLRLQLHNVRMQMHTLMMDRNAHLTGRNGVEHGMNGTWLATRALYGPQTSATKL